MEKTCSVEGCEKQARARGWCSMHYKRWQKHGDLNVKKGRWDNHERKLNTCIVPGCERQQYKTRMCNMHRSRFHKHGDPNIVKPHRRLYEFNETVLDQWTSRSAYLLGWIVTDGNVREYAGAGTSSALIFDLKDKEAIEILRGILGHPQEPANLQGYWRLRVHSMHLSARLKELGVRPAKSLSVELPTVPEGVFPHFVRGVVDGDGSLILQRNTRARTGPKDYLRVQVSSASQNFLPQLRNALPFDGSLFQMGKGKRKNPLWRLVFSGKEALRFCDWIYSDSDGMRLTRKHQRYLVAKGDRL